MQFTLGMPLIEIYIYYLYIYVCVCVCVCVYYNYVLHVQHFCPLTSEMMATPLPLWSDFVVELNQTFIEVQRTDSMMAE